MFSKPGVAETVLATAADHHRLAWIHPFLDGNGRVIRLISHATLLNILNTGALWSLARGLARNVDAYKTHLAECDLTRRNDLDGRGNLSEEALAKFTEFFLKTCINQIEFMEALMKPDQLRGGCQTCFPTRSIDAQLLPVAPGGKGLASPVSVLRCFSSSCV
ncbi:MAG: Fic family protein [Pseudomonadota bacterium]